jgi:maleylacetoacetate isomerase/maleylpyruvate isomerase
MAVDNPEGLVLYTYWRSSSAYRVRIALNLKGIDYRQEFIHLVRGGGQQHQARYREVNPLGLVPALEHGGHTIVQSLAICEYLEDVFPEHPLLPEGPVARARVRSIAQSITSEIQPLNNLGVMQYLRDELQAGEAAVNQWYAHWIARGFAAVEAWLSQPATRAFCHGDRPTLADCFLVPQVYNAERFACDLGPYPNIRRITDRCRSLPEFQQAAPENQPDAAQSGG